MCRGQYKAKSPEPPFTPARQVGESGLLLLRKTSQLSPTEQALALNGTLHGHRGDTELQGQVVQTEEASCWANEVPGARGMLA